MLEQDRTFDAGTETTKPSRLLFVCLFYSSIHIQKAVHKTKNKTKITVTALTKIITQPDLGAVTIERYLKVVHHAWANRNLRDWMRYSAIAFRDR